MSSAEDVMDAYVEAYKNLEFEAIPPLLRGATRELELDVKLAHNSIPQDFTRRMVQTVRLFC